MAQGRLAQASQELRAAVRDMERSAAFLPSPHARSAFLADKWAVYGALAQVEMARGRDTTAFEVSEQVRSRQFLDELARGPVAWNAGADTALVRREQDLRRAITELSGQLDDAPSAAALVRGPDPALPTPSLTREALARTEAEYAELLDAPATAPAGIRARRVRANRVMAGGDSAAAREDRDARVPGHRLDHAALRGDTEPACAPSISTWIGARWHRWWTFARGTLTKSTGPGPRSR